MGNIEHGFNACKAAHEGFKAVADLPPLGSDAVSEIQSKAVQVE